MKSKIITALLLILMLAVVPTSARRNEFKEIKRDKNITYIHVPSLLTSSFSSNTVKISEQGMDKVKGIRVIQADNAKGSAHLDKWLRNYVEKQEAEPVMQVNQNGEDVDFYLLDADKKVNRLVIYTRNEKESCVVIIRGRVDLSQVSVQ